MNEQLSYYLYRLQILPRSTKLIILLVINGIIGYYFYDNSIKNVSSQYAKMHSQIKSKQRSLQEVLKIKNQFPELVKEIEKMTLALQEKLRKLPNTKEIPALLKTISREAMKSGLRIMLFKPMSEEEEGYFYRLPIKIKAAGTYHQVTLFCDKISKLSRIVNIIDTALTHRKSDTNRTVLEANFSFITYRFRDNMLKQKTKGGKRKKRT